MRSRSGSRASAAARQRPARRAPRPPTAATSAERTPPPPRRVGWEWPSRTGAAGRQAHGAQGAGRSAPERQPAGRSRGLERWQARELEGRRPSAPEARGPRHGSGRQPAARVERPRHEQQAPRPQRRRRAAGRCVSFARRPFRGGRPVRLTGGLGDAIHALELQQFARVELGDGEARLGSTRTARRPRVPRYRSMPRSRVCALRRRELAASTGQERTSGGRRRNGRLHAVCGPVEVGRRRERLRKPSFPGQTLTPHRASPKEPRHPPEPRTPRWPSWRARPRPR